MSILRLQERTPSAIFVTKAMLFQHTLLFHKVGQDSSAKCDAYETGNTSDIVYGVVFKISEAEKRVLDEIEGVGNGYNEKIVKLTASDGHKIRATTYYAITIDASLSPYHWYKQHVVTGARENGLPNTYIDAIDSVLSIADPDLERSTRESSIYL